jgi:hypothetical protein
MVDTKVGAASHKLCSFELSPVICQNPFGYDEPVYDALQELDHCFLLDIHYWYRSIHFVNVLIATNKNLNPPGALGKMPTMSIPPDCKGLGEINRPKRICMLHCLLLKELTVLAFGNDLHHVILSFRPVETVLEGFAYDRVP